LFRVTNPARRTADDDAVIRLYRADAADGDANAQFQLAWLYENGRGGLQKSEREAIRLYKLAAEQGNGAAQANLGIYYRNGEGGLEKDEREAARLFKLAANQGDAVGQCALADFYRGGRGGLAKDKREAVRLYALAAEQGNDYARSELAGLSGEGRGRLAKSERDAKWKHFVPGRLLLGIPAGGLLAIGTAMLIYKYEVQGPPEGRAPLSLPIGFSASDFRIVDRKNSPVCHKDISAPPEAVPLTSGGLANLALMKRARASASSKLLPGFPGLHEVEYLNDG
jgi:hypothetical protein